MSMALPAAIGLGAAIGSTSELASAQARPPGTAANEPGAGAVSVRPASLATPAVPAATGTSLPGSAATLPDTTPRVGAAVAGAHAPQVAAAAHTPLPPGQVWECVIDGARIFSDAPCGEHASIRQLRELNLMDSPPAHSSAYAHSYFPVSAPEPVFAPEPADDSDHADYWGPEVLWVHGYARRNHLPRQDGHVRPQSHPHPRRN